MATIDRDLPWRNNEDWDALIDEVNAVLENPVGSGCQPVPPIEHVPEKYRWGKSDIREMQDKIKETCPDISFEPIEDGYVRWQQSHIDEIREKLGEAWCSCENDSFPCPNCGDESETVWYSDPYVTKYCPPSTDCGLEPENVGDDILAKTGQVYDALFEWVNNAEDVCFLTTLISIKENQIDLIETQISSKQALASVLCDDGPSEACQTVQAEIAVLEATKALRETERDEAINEKAVKEGLRDDAGDLCESLNDENWELIESMAQANLSPAPANLGALARAAAGSHPWAEVGDCTPAGISPCIPQYEFWRERITDGTYRLLWTGLYTPISGTAIHGFELFAHTAYIGSNGGSCTGPTNECTTNPGTGPAIEFKIIYRPPPCFDAGPGTIGGDDPDVPTSGD